MAGTNGVDVSNMSLDDIENMEVPSDPNEALAMLQGIFKQAEELAMKREILTLLHKMIQDTIKKIGQAA